MKCVACRKGEPIATNAETTELHPQVPEWQIIKVDNVKMLERMFKFENFSEALRFTNKVGEIAEAEGHYPSIITDWGRVTVKWWTHKIRGLHRNNFIMAAKTDQLYKR
jgi:4a-hydroxytetrahydrobiopterin dehydratase